MDEADMHAGRVVAVLVIGQGSSLASERRATVRVTLEGLEGDRHAGFIRRADGRTPHYPRGTPIRNDRQVSVVSAEDLEAIARSLAVAEVQPEWLGANLLLRGIRSLTQLPANTRLIFPEEAVLVVQRENLPCTGPGRALAAHYDRPSLASEFPRVALHLRGVVACVERAGMIREGDEVRIEIPDRS